MDVPCQAVLDPDDHFEVLKLLHGVLSGVVHQVAVRGVRVVVSVEGVAQLQAAFMENVLMKLLGVFATIPQNGLDPFVFILTILSLKIGLYN